MLLRDRGFTLLELMLALLLGALLGGAALQAFAAASRTLQWQVELLRLEQNAQHALGLLRTELQMAGFYARTVQPLPPAPPGAPGCGAHDRWPLVLDTPLALINDVVPAEGILLEGESPDCLPIAALEPGTDVLGIKRTASRPSGPVAGDGFDSLPLRPGYWYLEYREPGVPLQWRRAVAGDVVPAGAQWWQMRATLLFVRRYSVHPGDGVPSLCREQLRPSGMRTECLVEGVESLHLEFGLDEDGDGTVDRWAQVATPAQLRAALQARVYLLMRSISRLSGAPDHHAYALGAREIEVEDSAYLRRVVSATVALLPGSRA